MSIHPAKRLLGSVTTFLEDVAERILPATTIQHPVQVEKAVLRVIDRKGILVFLNEVYICNVVILLMNPADMEYTKTFPKTFREELLRSIRGYVQQNYGHAKNIADIDHVELKIIEDTEVPAGKIDVEVRFDESRRGVEK